MARRQHDSSERTLSLAAGALEAASVLLIVATWHKEHSRSGMIENAG
jgi:hypothetical protein